MNKVLCSHWWNVETPSPQRYMVASRMVWALPDKQVRMALNRYLLRSEFVVTSTMSCSVGLYKSSHSLVARMARTDFSQERYSLSSLLWKGGKFDVEGGFSFLVMTYWRSLRTPGSADVVS